MHIAGDKIEFDTDAADNSGDETFYRRVDSTHYEDVTHDPTDQHHFESRKLFELAEDEKP
jgi:hypothetical protein